jgi:hypothetical protein
LDRNSEITAEETVSVTEDPAEDETKGKEPPTKPPDIFEEADQITNETTS